MTVDMTMNDQQSAGAPVVRLFRPPAVPQVRVGGFWGQRADAVAGTTVHILYDRAVKARMLDQIDIDREPPGKIVSYDGGLMTSQMFWDSDFGKIIETAAYCLYRNPDADLEAKVDALVALYGKLQQDDGYLNSWFQRIEPGLRWSNLRDTHELYNAGHMIEGAAAYFQATGKRAFLDIVCRYVDHIRTVIGPEPGQLRGYCGHEEIELALVKLARVTGRREYLELAKYFIDERGQAPHFFDLEAVAHGRDPADYHFGTHEFSQSHKPVCEQDRVVGHAVRAMYLYAAMSDIAAEYGDAELEAALERLWADLTEKKLYLTGGLGPSRTNEGFTSDYDLPNATAYAETCASVGLVFWSSRMLGLRPDGRYADVMEQALYNGASSGLSIDGGSFFYENPLASQGDHKRWTWHRCPCCPPNIARLTASIGSYMYGEGDGELAVHLYCDSTAQLNAGVAGTVTLEQRTNYPWNGEVLLMVSPERDGPFTLHVRIPGWSRMPRLSINGEPFDAPAAVDGYIPLHRHWQAGDTVAFELDIQTRQVFANPLVAANAGKVALQRGPLVYCAEAVDNNHAIHAYQLPRLTDVEEVVLANELGGITALRIGAEVISSKGWEGNLYGATRPATERTTLTAIPYFAWANRAPGAMAVWLRSTDQ